MKFYSVVVVRLQILSLNFIAFLYIIYYIESCKILSCAKGISVARAIRRNHEMSSCASATACYLHLKGSARPSVLRFSYNRNILTLSSRVR